MLFFKIIQEGVSQAVSQLLGNKLRSFLSLLGISIGIFCIISVKSAVDSLEANIRHSFEKLGNDVLYISKTPWNEDPNGNYWKYLKRPDPDFRDFQAINEKSKFTDMTALSFFLGFKTLKYKDSHISNVFAIAVTEYYADMFKLEFEHGRYYSTFEYQNASDKIVIGHNTAENLFGPLDPIGKYVIVLGKRMQVIGVIKKGGRDLINPLNFDDCFLMSYNLARKYLNLGTNSPFGTSLNVKAKSNINLEDLEGEVTGILRNVRQLKPLEKDDFAINKLSLLAGFLDSIFGVLNIVGFMIGIFALFVGMFSVANIMFVSVKERTNIIGIKKAIGAKSNVILIEFLIEAVILCIFGGLLGLAFVFAIAELVTVLLNFEINLTLQNVVLGLSTSAVIGVIAGLLPAFQAARMDPVEAMRR
ncbi:MAG: ABC transporter permease [Saprospiraceae bacterium]